MKFELDQKILENAIQITGIQDTQELVLFALKQLIENNMDETLWDYKFSTSQDLLRKMAKEAEEENPSIANWDEL
jgi:Bacterial antitoxin of type II TA system, VapB